MSDPLLSVTVHMVSSVDGIIAKKDNSVSWFEISCYYENGAELTEQDTENFLKTIDCYVMGARTYEHALELSAGYGWPYGDVPVIVISHQKLEVHRPNIEIYSGDLRNLADEKLQPKYRNVWVVGGPTLIKNFIRLKLADEIRISVLPIILGEGIRFFDNIQQEQLLHLKNVTAYKTGMVELCYNIIK